MKNIMKKLVFSAVVTILVISIGCNKSKEFTKALQSEDAAKREEAAMTLSTLKDPKTVPALINALDDDSFAVRKYAAEALFNIGEPAVLPLIDALNSESWTLKRNAEGTLWKIDPVWIRRKEAVRAVPYFIQNFKNKEDDFILQRSLQSIQNIGEPAKEYLIAALKDENENISYYAGRALVEIDLFWTRSEAAKKAIPELVSALNDENPKVRVNAGQTLKRIGKESIKYLLTALRHKDWKTQRRAEAILNIIDPNWYVGDDAKRAVPDFIAALKDENEAVRLGAVVVLGKIQDDRVIKPLIDSLDDEFLYARVNARKALEKITGKGFGNDLEKWLNWWKENKETKFFPAAE